MCTLGRYVALGNYGENCGRDNVLQAAGSALTSMEDKVQFCNIWRRGKS